MYIYIYIVVTNKKRCWVLSITSIIDSNTNFTFPSEFGHPYVLDSRRIPLHN